VDRAIASADARWQAAFGPFLLSPDERLLQRDGAPVRLGGRALDLLITLVENAGAVISKKDLLARVWEGVVVDEGSLRFHMYVVRKALGDGEGGTRYVVNTANKGYTFVAPVERRSVEVKGSPLAGVSRSLPALRAAMVGRDEDVKAIVETLEQRRFVSVVGSGGIGKTTVAIASAQSLASQFEGDVQFIDLSLISAAEMVRSTVASAIGLLNASADLPTITTHLVERRTLLVLDCCEHVISGAAELAESLVRGCPFVHILATSREPLRAEGEFVHRLQALAAPPEGEGSTAASALAYPAVRLFVDRARANSSGFEFRDADAALTSQLCRELDGIALAIELAAGRIEALGLRAVTSHLDAKARLMWHGRRTAVPRHQTLGATLDWSYRLLAEDEKRLVRRLAIFAGSFSLDAAIEVCCFDVETSVAIELLAGLVSKSLVNVDAGGTALRYDMLDTTRAYCWSRLADSGEDAAVSQRFSSHFAAWVDRQGAEPVSMEAADLIHAELPNIRSALEWLLGQEGGHPEAVQLAASFCPLLLRLSRLADCARWAQAALLRMPLELAGSPLEVRLQGALAQSLMFTGGDADDAMKAFRRGIDVAESHRDFRTTLHLLNGYAVLLHRDGRYTDALSVARKAQSLLPEVGDPESRAVADSLLGVAHNLVGNVAEAMQHFERACAHRSHARTETAAKLGFDPHIRAQCGIARTLWLTGRYSQALTVADETIAKARDHGHAVTYCIALLWAGSVYTYASDMDRLESMVATLERVARQHSLVPYLNVASVTRGQMLITQGRPAEGVERIRTAVEALHLCRYEMVTSVSLTFMAKGLSDLSLHAAALAQCDDAMRVIQTGGDFLRMPELLITRGQVLAAAGEREEAAKHWLAAIELARSQGVTSAQVRAAVALAAQWTDAGRMEDARRLLRPHLADAGDETSPDLTIARRLLQ
jgi:predicted ATPase/DNA-binding winged helix-turn-helix (wHTH) protein